MEELFPNSSSPIRSFSSNNAIKKNHKSYFKSLLPLYPNLSGHQNSTATHIPGVWLLLWRPLIGHGLLEAAVPLTQGLYCSMRKRKKDTHAATSTLRVRINYCSTKKFNLCQSCSLISPDALYPHPLTDPHAVPLVTFLTSYHLLLCSARWTSASSNQDG